MSKKEEIISIDLDEDKKEEPKREIEIKAGDLYIRVKEDVARIEEAIRILEAFVTKLQERPKKESVEQPTIPVEVPKEEEKGRDILKEAEEEIKKTQDFLDKAEKKEEKIVTEATKENETVLNEGQTYERCPKCNGKLKKKKVQQFQDGLVQEIKCKNRKCGWSHIYKIAI